MSNPTNLSEQQEITLDRYFTSVWRAKWLIAGVTIAAAGVAWFIAHRQPLVHSATALLEVGRVWKEPIEDPYVTREILNGNSFPREIAEKLGMKPHQLKRSVHTEVVEGGARRERYPIFIRITATSESPDEALKLVQAVSDATVGRHEKLFADAIASHLENQHRIEQLLREDSPQQGPTANRDLSARLQTELGDVKTNNVSPILTRKTAIIEAASLSATIQPEVWRRVAAAGLIAAFAAIAVFIILGHFGGTLTRVAPAR